MVVDWSVTKASPVGHTILAFLEGLNDVFHFVVVAAYFENPSAETIEHVRVRVPPGPSFITELCWPNLVRFAFWRRNELRRRETYVAIATQGQLPGAEIASAAFCHRAYLDRHFATSGTRGLRRASRFLVHRYSARLERKAFRRARVVTVPSLGLAREIAEYYPFAAEKLAYVPYPVDVGRLAPSDDFDRAAARRELGLPADDVVFVFVALGDFARKGLEVGMRALALLGQEAESASIVVVGGTEGEIDVYRGVAAELGVQRSVHFVGFRSDVRPYLWAADAFLFPTAYESFSLATFQAAAAGLPVIATRVHGIEDLIEHGSNGWAAQRTPEAFAEVMRAALVSRVQLPEMGRRAQEAVRAYDVRYFHERWSDILHAVISGRELPRGIRPVLDDDGG